MLKLVKYDFRRDRDKFLAVFVIIILAQIGLGFTKLHDYERFILNGLTYVIAGLIFLVMAARTFFNNINSYNRRLLPVRTLNTVLSPLVLFLALLLGIILIALMHLGVYLSMYSTLVLPENFWTVGLLVLLQAYWFAGYIMLTLMVSITVARSVKFKGRVWIGLATAYLLQNGISYLEYLIFKSNFTAWESVFQFEVIAETDTRSGIQLTQGHLNLAPLLFEAVIAVLLIAVIIKLVKKRVDA
ncbi:MULTISPECIES: hypothetical protein [Paenibacillus]|uniref:hypothetical protein n=1 Tax=Paenibacillus TaxID=44249 RepID=UPI00096E1563|nr:hypothetical protein [Paenibacillus odorifer]OMD01746.1 hypothetical protein BJP46_18275 [Paenibacillus odorifer]OZQ76801.1 hypothetical protein CA596_09090 [Paenibacillus odorifer]